MQGFGSPSIVDLPQTCRGQPCKLGGVAGWQVYLPCGGPGVPARRGGWIIVRGWITSSRCWKAPPGISWSPPCPLVPSMPPSLVHELLPAECVPHPKPSVPTLSPTGNSPFPATLQGTFTGPSVATPLWGF